jgi:hypothetical protein
MYVNNIPVHNLQVSLPAFDIFDKQLFMEIESKYPYPHGHIQIKLDPLVVQYTGCAIYSIIVVAVLIIGS